MALGLRSWRNFVPLVAVLTHYRREDLSHDLLAGLVVGMVTIPQAVAYAYLAGVPPQSGLYACLLPMVIYAIFGSSKQMVFVENASLVCTGKQPPVETQLWVMTFV